MLSFNHFVQEENRLNHYYYRKTSTGANVILYREPDPNESGSYPGKLVFRTEDELRKNHWYIATSYDLLNNNMNKKIDWTFHLYKTFHATFKKYVKFAENLKTINNEKIDSRSISFSMFKGKPGLSIYLTTVTYKWHKGRKRNGSDKYISYEFSDHSNKVSKNRQPLKNILKLKA